MLAATVRRYGGPDVVGIEDLPLPPVGPGEMRVRVNAAAVTAADARLRANDAPRGFGLLLRCVTGLRRPRHPVGGMEFAGVVDRLGTGVLDFKPGQRVFGITGLQGGAHAEFLTIRGDARVFATPDTLHDTQAAAFFFGGLTAAHFLCGGAGLQPGLQAALQAAWQPGQRLLINGATGPVGCAAIQLACHLGAQVTAVARVQNHAFARELGAHYAIDYRAGPIKGHWDVILDVVGTLPCAQAAPLLRTGGRLLKVTATLAEQMSFALRTQRGSYRVLGGVTADGRAAMQGLMRLHAAGAWRPTVGTVMPFSDIAAAHALAGSRHQQGSTVVVMPR